MRVLITRAEPAASRTAKLVEAAGHEPLKLPLFEVRDTGKALPDHGASNRQLHGYIFSSNNALAVLKARGWKPENLSLPVFCVGKKTASNARAFGFKNVTYEQGGGARLVPEILKAGLPQHANLDYLTTPNRSFDMAQALSNHSINVENIEIYQATTTDVTTLEFGVFFNKNKPDVILTYSQRSSDHLAQYITACGLADSLSKIRLVAISRQAISELSKLEWRETFTPDIANETAMLHILGN